MVEAALADFPDVAFHDATDMTAMIAVQGPKAVEIVGKLLPPKVLGLKYYKGVSDRAVWEALHRDSDRVHRRRWI